MVQSKEEKNKKKSEYHQANKKELNEKKREYYQANKKEINERIKKYHEEHKKERNEYLKDYTEKNKDKIAERHKKWRLDNLERIKQQQKAYNQTDAGKKASRIGNWKILGVISDDYSSLYDYYLNCKKCEICSIDLVEGIYGRNKRVLDHNHQTGEFRNVLCHICNINLK